MRRSISLFVISFCLQVLFIQAKPANPIVSFPLLTQDSVYTRIENGKAITTFKVTAPITGNYILKFWLMGVKHTDATFSSYALRIDTNPVTDSVVTDRGDWHVYRPSNSSLVYFTQGQHDIHLEGTLSDVPNAERVITLSSFNENPVLMDANMRYAKMKNHENYSFFISGEDSLETNYRVINYNRLEDDISNGPFHFNAELNKKVYYTFFRLEYFTKDQVVSIITDEENGVGHVLNVFSKSNPYNNTWADSTSSNGHANLNITIPKTDFYYVMVRTKSPNDYGTCSLTINGDKRFEGVPICNSTTHFQHIQFGPLYSCFAKSNVGDPMILFMGSNERVYDFNDDYPFDPTSSNYNWGNNARIDGLLYSNTWIFTTAKSYPPEIEQRFDIYVGCKIINFNDDEIISSDVADVLNWNFNCIAWSIGSWTTWINSNISIEDYDSLYALYGYERISNEGSSKIDLWMDGNEISHASIKSKTNPYAAGYDWESKKGGLERVFHPRYALSEYGQVAYHYKKKFSGSIYSSIPFLSFAFTHQETEQIEKQISLIPKPVKEMFSSLLSECYNDRELMLCSSTKKFPKFASYKKLLDYCSKTSGTDYMLYNEIGERKVIPVKILQDITQERNPQILKEVEKQCERLGKSDTIKAIQNVQADGMLLAKILLSGLSDIVDIEESVVYSSDNLLNVLVDGNKLDISFNLDFDATATVVIGSMDGLGIKRIADHKQFQTGINHLYFSVPKPGIYTVSLMLNGGLYEKKVYIK